MVQMKPDAQQIDISQMTAGQIIQQTTLGNASVVINAGMVLARCLENRQIAHDEREFLHNTCLSLTELVSQIQGTVKYIDDEITKKNNP